MQPIALFVIAVVSVIAIAPSTPVYWDTFGYVVQAVTGEVGGLGLGRPVFVLVSHAIARTWLGAGGSPWQLELVLRWFWMAVSCAAAPLTWRLAALCGLSRRGAFLAGLAVACSPAMAHTSGTLLTDGPAVSLYVLGLVLGARAIGDSAHPPSVILAAAAGAAIGLATGVREQSITGLVSLALISFAAPSGVRLRLLVAMTITCAAVVVAPLAFVVLTESGYLDTVRNWMVEMAREREARAFKWGNTAMGLGWILALGPAVVVAAIAAFANRRSEVWRFGTVLFAVVVPSAVALIWLATYQNLFYSPRYLLSSLPGALAIPAALAFDRWLGPPRRRLAVAFVALPLVVAAPFVRYRAVPLENAIRAWPSTLMELPSNSVIVSGQLCPVVPMVQTLVANDPRRATGVPDWQTVCPGWSWPSDLPARLDRALAEGRTVVIDLRASSWFGAEQAAARVEADAYQRARASVRARGGLIVFE